MRFEEHPVVLLVHFVVEVLREDLEERLRRDATVAPGLWAAPMRVI